MLKIGKSFTMKLFLIFALLASGLCLTFSTQVFAATDHSTCGENYCLVCDVANKVNALPEAEDITIDNAAAVIQQINDIDRIKYDLTDEQFEELTTLVATHDNGVDRFVITKYDAAIVKINALTGVDLTISKSFNMDFLGGGGLYSTESAEITFEIKNLGTNQTTTLTMFDLGASTSALGEDYYSMTATGWTFKYKLPAGEYSITEIQNPNGVILNDKVYYTSCESITDGEQTVYTNTMNITLTEGNETSVLVTNAYAATDFTEWQTTFVDAGYALSDIKELHIIDSTPDEYDVVFSMYDANGDYAYAYYNTNTGALYFVPTDTDAVVLSGATSKFFSGLTSCETIVFTALDVSAVTSLHYFFYNNTSLMYLTLENFNTSNVTKMFGMFSGCESLPFINLEEFGFDLSSVTTMGHFAENCKALQGFYASVISAETAPLLTDVSYMFYGAGVVEIDFSNIDASKLEENNLKSFLYGCADALEIMKLSDSMAVRIGEANIYNQWFSYPDSDALWYRMSDLTTYAVTASGMDEIASDGVGGTYEIHKYANGFCMLDGHGDYCFMPALDTDQNGYYEITNGGNLMWFSTQVQLGYNTINAEVVAEEINLLNGNNEQITWLPIGSTINDLLPASIFKGVFNGKNNTIDLGTQTVQTDKYGLVGYAQTATIENVVVTGTFNVDAAVVAVGGVLGDLTGSGNGYIKNCYSYVNIALTSNAAGAAYLGGIAGAIHCGDSGALEITHSAYYGNIDAPGAVECIAGILGYGQVGLIADCANYGNISATDAQHVAGILGYVNYYGWYGLYNCLNASQTIEGKSDTEWVGQIVGYLRKHTTNSVYNNFCIEGDVPAFGAVELTDRNPQAEAVSLATMASGEIAWRLNNGVEDGSQIWYQTLETDAYPYFEGETVYNVITGGCAEHVYTYGYSNTNVDTIDDHEYANGQNNGFCDVCGAYEEPTLVDGVYQIANGGNLFWFANLVNNGTYDVDAVIIVDVIDLENRLFAGIGGSTTDNAFQGCFDGANATIKNLQITRSDDGNCVGLFNIIYNAEIKNFSLIDSTITVTGALSNVGSIAGASNTSTISNVWSSATIVYTGTGTPTYYGGISGSSTTGVFEKCGFDGTITVNENIQTVGGIVGYGAWGATTTIKDCIFAGTINSAYSDGNTTVSNSIIPFISGFLGYTGSTSFVEALENLLYVGTINYTGNSSELQGITYFASINDSTNLGSKVNNLYYKAQDTGVTTTIGGSQVASNYEAQITQVTTAQVESGEVAWRLNNGVEDGTQVWYQDIATDAHPYFEGETVYQVIVSGCTDETYEYTYTNSSTLADNITHCTNGYKYAVDDEDATAIAVYCADCGALLQKITIKLPDYLGYTGENITITFNTETIVEGYDVEHSVAFAYLYSETETGFFAEVDEVKEYGFYQAQMTVGSPIATFAFDNAQDSVTVTSEVFEVVDTTVTFNFLEMHGRVIATEVAVLDLNNLDDIQNVTVPTWTFPSNEYYTYTFKYWQSTDGNKYLTDEIPSFNSYYTQGVQIVDFQVVYDVKYNKNFHLQGSIDAQTGLSTSGIYSADQNVKIVAEGETVTVYTNFAITVNDGIASILLIPEYDSNFTITAVSVNGQLMYGSGVSSVEVLSGWTATVSGTEAAYERFKIILENLPVSDATSENIFIQIAYTMENVVIGEYNFGFYTQYASETYDATTDSELSHNDRSEAYGVRSDSELAAFNELKITVTEANIIIVKRQDTTLTMTTNSVIYDAALAEIYEDSNITDAITNVFVYHYGGCATKLADGSDHDWTQYITIKWYTADDVELAEAPTNVGNYKIGLAATENDYFNAIDEIIFDVSITPYTINVGAEKTNDKTYNATEQTWTETDFAITDTIAALNGETGYNLVITDATYKNTGTYTVTLTFTATENYTFTENATIANAGDTKIITLDVLMNKFALTITADDKTSEYSDEIVELTYALSATNNNEDASFANTDTDLNIALTTDASTTSDVGNYNITVSTSSTNDNYEFTIIHNQDVNNYPNGTYTITRKQITAPVIEVLVYNGTEQFPEVPAEATVNGVEVYAFNGNAQINAGDYTLDAVLISDNYVWADYVSTSDEDKLTRTLDWEISRAELHIEMGNVTEDYGKTQEQALAAVMAATTATGLMGDDNLSDIIQLYFDNDYDEGVADDAGYVKVGTHKVSLSETAANVNYSILYASGTYTALAITLQIQLQDNITSNVKEYTGSEIVWLTEDFTLDGVLENGENITDVLEITLVAKQDDNYIDANGKGDYETWTYYDPETNLYYTVTVKVKDDRQSAYSFGLNDDVAVYEQNVDVEVFIKQATNAWLISPAVNAVDIANITTTSQAMFGDPAEIKYYVDEQCQTEIQIDAMAAGTTYYANFVVSEVNNFTGLNEVVQFNLNFGFVAIPVVYLDGNVTNIVEAGGTVYINYDGLSHKFTITTGDDAEELASATLYTVTLSTEYSNWKNANDVYIATIEIDTNYKWSSTTDTINNNTQNSLIYTLNIDKTTLSIVADDKVITYRDATPAYTATDSGFVNGETYATYQEGFDIASYITSEYVQGDTGKGEYAISFVENATSTLENIFTNYNIQLEEGTLFVEALSLDLSNLKAKLDNYDEDLWTNFILNNLTTEYNSQLHEVVLNDQTYPDDLVPTITYVYHYNTMTEVKNGGEYVVDVKFNVADGLDADNFTWTDPDPIMLIITKLAITAVVDNDVTVYYTGNQITSIPSDASTITIKLTSSDEVITDSSDYAFVLNETSASTVLSAYKTEVGRYEGLVAPDLVFNETNYSITYVNSALIIVKDNLDWAIQLLTTNKIYDALALVEGLNENDITIAKDYYAVLDESASRDYLTYQFYTSNAVDAVALTDIPVNAGTYYIKAFYDDTIYAAINTDFVEIVIQQATITLGADDVTVNYLVNYDVNPTYEMPTLGAEDNYTPVILIEYQKVGESEYTTVQPTDVGEYIAKVTVSNLNDNYVAPAFESTIVIEKASLADAEFTYNLDTVTWQAIEQTVDNNPIDTYEDVLVKYVVTAPDATETVVDATDLSFVVTQSGIYSLTVIILDTEGNENTNFNTKTTSMNEVFFVAFMDSADNHNKNQNVIDFASINSTKTQYRFEGENATQPYITEAEQASVALDGYTFQNAWTNNDEKYTFLSGVTENLTLYAVWEINVYTISWYNNNQLIYEETYEYLDTPIFQESNYGTPERSATAEWIYTFIGWGTENDGQAITLPNVTENEEYYAIFTKTGVIYTITFMLAIDSGNYEEYAVREVNFETLLWDICSLTDVNWFRIEAWFIDENRETEILTAPVGNTTVYGAYVFDIGIGDVNANGTVTTDDITLYRQWIVGGYDMTVIESGDEWQCVNSQDFAEDGIYFLLRTSDINFDTSCDIRDVTTIRMALVGGYGYSVDDGVQTNAAVTGQAVVLGESQNASAQTFAANFEDADIKMFNSASQTQQQTSKNTVILLEAVSATSTHTTVEVNLKENAGIYSMVLTIEYDRNALTLVGFEYGDALVALDPLFSADFSVYPFKVSYVGKNDTNDYSVGNLLTLNFEIKETVADGKYAINLTYDKNKDINFLTDTEIKTKNIAVNSVLMSIQASAITGVTTTTVQNGNLALNAIVIAVVCAVGVILFIAVRIKHTTKKGKWVKL